MVFGEILVLIFQVTSSLTLCELRLFQVLPSCLPALL